jgi:hypothetical protein
MVPPIPVGQAHRAPPELEFQSLTKYSYLFTLWNLEVYWKHKHVLDFTFLLGFLLVLAQSVFQKKSKANYVVKLCNRLCLWLRDLWHRVLYDLHGIRPSHHGFKACFVSLEIVNLEL